MTDSSPSDNYPPLSEQVLLARGYCCGKGCQNCPYVDEFGNSHVLGSTTIKHSQESPSDRSSSTEQLAE